MKQTPFWVCGLCDHPVYGLYCDRVYGLYCHPGAALKNIHPFWSAACMVLLSGSVPSSPVLESFLRVLFAPPHRQTPMLGERKTGFNGSISQNLGTVCFVFDFGSFVTHFWANAETILKCVCFYETEQFVCFQFWIIVDSMLGDKTRRAI